MRAAQKEMTWRKNPFQYQDLSKCNEFQTSKQLHDQKPTADFVEKNVHVKPDVLRILDEVFSDTKSENKNN